MLPLVESKAHPKRTEIIETEAGRSDRISKRGYCEQRNIDKLL